MSTDLQKKTKRDTGRTVYRFTVDQVFRMIDAGILPDHKRLELWDGVLYKMTKYEPHNFSVAETAEALRRLIPPDCHVREEKTARFGDYSLPEPDVAVARRARRAYQSRLPELHELALVVEVCASTDYADRKVKPRRFAQVGIPVYWLVDVKRRQIEIFTQPEGNEREALYSKVEIYSEGREFPVIIDGREVGRIAVADILPNSAATEMPDESDQLTI